MVIFCFPPISMKGRASGNICKTSFIERYKWQTSYRTCLKFVLEKSVFSTLLIFYFISCEVDRRTQPSSIHLNSQPYHSVTRWFRLFPPHPFFKGKPWGRGWQASKKFYNKCSENSRSQIVFRTNIFRKLSLGAPDVLLKSGKNDQYHLRSAHSVYKYKQRTCWLEYLWLCFGCSSDFCVHTKRLQKVKRQDRSMNMMFQIFIDFISFWQRYLKFILFCWAVKSSGVWTKKDGKCPVIHPLRPVVRPLGAAEIDWCISPCIYYGLVINVGLK